MRILVIGDRTKTAGPRKAHLGLRGHSVASVCTGAEGHELAGVESHDVTVLDPMLLDGDGLEICRNCIVAR